MAKVRRLASIRRRKNGHARGREPTKVGMRGKKKGAHIGAPLQSVDGRKLFGGGVRINVYFERRSSRVRG